MHQGEHKICQLPQYDGTLVHTTQLIPVSKLPSPHVINMRTASAKSAFFAQYYTYMLTATDSSESETASKLEE